MDTLTQLRSRYDAIVVGARPAGAATGRPDRLLPLRVGGGGRSGEAAGWRRGPVRAAPGIAEALGGARLDGALRAFPGEAGFLRRARGPGWALVGDAGYFRDPLTAHGITDALRDAELLARAVICGTHAALTEYQEARDDAALGVFEVSDAIASVAWTLDEARAHHQALSRHMAREGDLLRALDRAEPAVAA